MAKIVKLQAENVKRIEVVEITPDGNLVVIGGRNGAGKTSLLDSIEMLLGGKRAQTERPVHEGEENAYIRGELDTNYVISKTINAKTGREELTVTDKAGGKYSGGAQTLLDNLYNKHTIDPRRFATLDKDKRYKTLAQIAGVDPEPIERRILGIFEQRKMLNPKIQELEGKVSGFRFHQDVPEVEHSVTDISQQIREATAKANEYDRTQENLKKAWQDIADYKAKIEELENFAASAQSWLEQNPKPDLEQLNTALAKVDEVNTKVRENAWQKSLSQELSNVKGQYNKFSTQLEEARKEKQELLNRAQYPIPGISLKDGEIYYEDIPFSEISASKRLILGAAIGFAQSPELKILLIKDAPYIDDESMQQLYNLAAAVDGQIWIEKGGDQGVSVVIEDGRVRGGSQAVPHHGDGA